MRKLVKIADVIIEGLIYSVSQITTIRDYIYQLIVFPLQQKTIQLKDSEAAVQHR